MAKKNKDKKSKGGGHESGPLPAVTSSRLLVRTPDGGKVDNVTRKNRYDIHKHKPWITVDLMNEDVTAVIEAVEIPHTREFPDVVMWRGKPYEVLNTRLNPPQYRECMVAVASEPEKEDTTHEPTNPPTD